jgi:hypothetical protein
MACALNRQTAELRSDGLNESQERTHNFKRESQERTYSFKRRYATQKAGRLYLVPALNAGLPPCGRYAAEINYAGNEYINAVY